MTRQSRGPSFGIRVVNKLRRQFGPNISMMAQYAPAPTTPEEAANYNDLERFFHGSSGRRISKWKHYFEIYDRFFAPWRGTPVRMLEIGVLNGGSLEMWRDYFGASATIFGIDINPACAAFDGEAGAVRIGSQTDPAFLRSVVEEMGGLDLVLDDGSHVSPHMRASLEILFPLLSDGGLYLVEDTHASYWTDHQGGYAWPWSFMSYARSLTDDMHHWYHRRGSRSGQIGKNLRAIHFYDSIVVLEKRTAQRPQHLSGGIARDVKS